MTYGHFEKGAWIVDGSLSDCDLHLTELGVNFGHYDHCERENATPVCCCHFLHKPVSLSNVDIAVLVTELEKRSRESDKYDVYSVDFDETLYIRPMPYNRITGPAKILVIREGVK